MGDAFLTIECLINLFIYHHGLKSNINILIIYLFLVRNSLWHIVIKIQVNNTVAGAIKA